MVFKFAFDINFALTHRFYSAPLSPTLLTITRRDARENSRVPPPPP